MVSEMAVSTNNATNSIDSTDWSQYPPDRVEGLKLFFRGPSSEEDGPPTEDELKMLCLKWDCTVDMKIDNFVFWHMRKMFRVRFKSNKERFLRYIPKIFDQIERHGMESYTQYQKDYGEKNKEYLQKCLTWRKHELRRLRYLDKLEALCSTWSDSESDDETDSESDDQIESSVSSTWSLNNSTVIHITGSRYADYFETQSLDIQGDILSQDQDQPATQTFIPEATSTQN